MKLYAHSNPKFPDDLSQWEPLLGEDGHLAAVERYAQKFVVRAFAHTPATKKWEQLGTLAAKWHDLGKFSNEFQDYLRQAGSDVHAGEMRGTVDHTSAGAQHAMEALPAPMNALIAYPIAGHHAGLHDGHRAIGASLLARLKKQDLPAWKDHASAGILSFPEVALPKVPQGSRNEIAFHYAFAVRILFSCLTDADFLATESFMNPGQAQERLTDDIDFNALDQHLQVYLAEHFGKAKGEVAKARSEVLAACRAKATGKPGLYSLTVPTGGGKTFSSLAFALRHCAVNRRDRVIYAIPFTSIIEQTAKVFREAFQEFSADPDALILEHHSNFDPERETTRSRLASENWDAPLIVTTNVQLFESLFANRTSRCRKLHRLTGSVIILDEAQTLPVRLLKPCLKALKILVESYGCTVVLCTATQPAIEFRDDFPIGLQQAIPIIEDAPALYARLKRVDVREAGTLGCEQLAIQVALENQGLVIVNTRKHAAELYAQLKAVTDPEGCYHLSAAMTPEHRSRKLDEIRKRLAKGQCCRVISTQLIEAGVDVDFPVVWRALAGLDSIAQAAGRCNREGKQTRAVTWVFRPAEEAYAKLFDTLRTGADAAAQITAMPQYNDLLAPDAIKHYFRLHYWRHEQDWDKHQICDQFMLANDRELPLYFNFKTVADRFRLIDSPQRPVIVPWDEKCRELVERLRNAEQADNAPPRRLVRPLQRHTVTVGKYAWEQAQQAGHFELLYDRFAVLNSTELHYSNELGLRLENELYEPEALCST